MGVRQSEFNKESLREILNTNSILYRYYGKEFGARREDLALYTTDGYVDFERVVHSADFLCGVEKICRGMSIGYTFALMCAEKEPVSCHRAILVARAFAKKGYNVIHLSSDHCPISQEQLELRLLDMYFPARTQLSIFGDSDNDALLKEAYRRQNAIIGFRQENFI